MPKKLRLLLNTDCNRNCAGCCNQDWDLSSLAVCKDFRPYETIMLTGGEPMLHPELIYKAVAIIRTQNPDAKILLYTAMVDDLHTIMRVLDGVTVTLHEVTDVNDFIQWDVAHGECIIGKRCRINIFTEATNVFNIFRRQVTPGWKIKEDITWIKNAPLPDGEIFMRFA